MAAILDNPGGFTLSSDLAVSPTTGIAVALDHTPLTYSGGAFTPDGRGLVLDHWATEKALRSEPTLPGLG